MTASQTPLSNASAPIASGVSPAAMVAVPGIPAPQEPERESWRWAALSNACAARFAQDSVLWAIIGSFTSTNAVLLVALGASGRWSSDIFLQKLICLTGLTTSLLWTVMQALALRRVKAYEEVIRALESALRIPADSLLLADNDAEASASKKPKRILPRARLIMPIVPILVALAWGAGLWSATANLRGTLNASKRAGQTQVDSRNDSQLGPTAR